MDQQDGKMENGLFNKCKYLSITAALVLLGSMQAVAADVTLAWDANYEPDLAGYKVYYGTASGMYTTQIVLGIQTTYSVSLAVPGTYFFAITAYNTAGLESGYSNEASAAVADATAPTIAITIPTPAGSYSTNTGTLTMGGTASDDVGVTQVTWSNSRGGSGAATGTASWSVAGITLQEGINILTVTARDAAGNTGTAALTVSYAKTDTTPPAIAITLPAASGGYYGTSSRTLAIGGTASDDVGVTQVTWSNDRGGSGTAAGTTNWSVNGITLQRGSNILTVTARDAAGNTSTAALNVSYARSTKADTTPPAVAITSPVSSGSYITAGSTLALGGTASDDVGVVQVTWSNDRGGSGTATGTTSWSVAGIMLQEGANVLTATARDAAGNAGAATITVYRNNQSGVVLNTKGTPIAGATTTLYRSDTAQGPFLVVPPGSSIFSPSNAVNPLLTNSSGYFGWNVADGYYRIRAEKSGCVAADQRTQTYVETGVLTIPPPQTTARLILYCGEKHSLFLPFIK